ncbi:hypothetical protein T05_10578 [Trichinella murrelli]|uniref:Uncharacterized protein n=1 Tax=Trichinella murrelli TaxID=144512 RepID=A0A0V0STF1_9BILA|nr:hypothetical protein T05_10578 [Trichinella murrelli]
MLHSREFFENPLRRKSGCSLRKLPEVYLGA